MKKGDVMGHEFMGVVEEVGPEVKNLSKGDRVVASFDIGCGKCFFCKEVCLPPCCLSLQSGAFVCIASLCLMVTDVARCVAESLLALRSLCLMVGRCWMLHCVGSVCVASLCLMVTDVGCCIV
jgi:threonine dehydrogenase-like Zn-dependent dehydrogenase